MYIYKAPTKPKKDVQFIGGKGKKREKQNKIRSIILHSVLKKNQHEDLCLIVLKYMYNIQDSILTHPQEIIVLKNKNFNKKW